MALFGISETDENAVPFSGKDGMAAARIAADVLHLLALDAVWTGAAQRRKREEMDDLGAVVDQMDASLTRLIEDTKVVLEILQGVREDRVNTLLSHSRLADGGLAGKLRNRAGRDGGVLPMIQKGLQRAGVTFSDERSQLRGELERIRKGHQSGGDLDSLTHCGLGLIEMGLGLGMAGGLPLFVDGAERVVENCAG